MDSPDLSVWLVAVYALVLLGVAWLVDVLGSRSARRSRNWRQADFVYHDDVDGWRCHEDQWLWPTAFDPDKRVIRYEGEDHEIKAGENFAFAKNGRHAITADGPFKMALLLTLE